MITGMWRSLGVRLHLRQYLDAVELGHHDIEQDQVARALGETRGAPPAR
jgi:hypothetical protein